MDSAKVDTGTIKPYHFNVRVEVVRELAVAVIASYLGRSVAVSVADAVGEQGAGKVDQVTREVLQAVLGCKVQQRR